MAGRERTESQARCQQCIRAPCYGEVLILAQAGIYIGFLSKNDDICHLASCAVFKGEVCGRHARTAIDIEYMVVKLEILALGIV